jgi:hypothetical protein
LDEEALDEEASVDEAPAEEAFVLEEAPAWDVEASAAET